MTVLASASVKAMETNIDVDRDPHVDPAARPAAEIAALDAIGSAPPGYAAEDRVRLAEVVEARLVEIKERVALLSSSERDGAASLSSFAAEPPENTAAKRLHDARLGRAAAFRVQMINRLDGAVAGIVRGSR